MKSLLFKPLIVGFISLAFLSSQVGQAATYLNIDNISVSVGPGTSPGSFQNTYSNGATIDKVIDAPSAEALEVHDQATHIWFTADTIGGGLELLFDFAQPYDITTVHFWNYTSESFDVDNVDFTFFDPLGSNIGSLSIQPALGTSPGIEAEDITLAAPLNVQSVRAFLTGSNRQVDFQNIGFTANATAVPEPTSIISFMVMGIWAFAGRRRRTRR